MSTFRKIIHTFKTVILSLPFLTLTSCRFLNDNGRQPWREVNNFVCYYGKGEIETLKTFDVAIIESDHFTKDEISSMQEKGTWVIGYISLGETRTLEKHDYSYYFDKNQNGIPDQNGEWGSWYVDTSNDTWIKKVLERVGNIVKNKTCDGVFLDTIDSVDVYPESKKSMVALIQKIRETYPHIKIIANRGFSIIDEIFPSIDGVMFEAFTTRYNNSTKKYEIYNGQDMTYVNSVAQKLNRIRGDKLVFALDYIKSQRDVPIIKAIKAHAKEFHFIPSIATRELNTILFPLKEGRE